MCNRHSSDCCLGLSDLIKDMTSWLIWWAEYKEWTRVSKCVRSLLIRQSDNQVGSDEEVRRWDPRKEMLTFRLIMIISDEDQMMIIR